MEHVHCRVFFSSAWEVHKQSVCWPVLSHLQVMFSCNRSRRSVLEPVRFGCRSLSQQESTAIIQELTAGLREILLKLRQLCPPPPHLPAPHQKPSDPTDALELPREQAGLGAAPPEHPISLLPGTPEASGQAAAESSDTDIGGACDVHTRAQLLLLRAQVGACCASRAVAVQGRCKGTATTKCSSLGGMQSGPI